MLSEEGHFKSYWHTYKVPLRDVFDLKSRGCRKLKGGNTGVPMYVSVPRFTGVVPLLLLVVPLLSARMLLKFRGSLGWNWFRVDIC